MITSIIFSYFHFLAFFVYLFLAGYVLIRNPKSFLNILVSAIPFTFSLWSLGWVFIHNANTTESFAMFLYRSLGFTWYLYPYLFFLFTLIFVGAKRILSSKIFYFFIILLPSILIYLNWREDFQILVKESYGWAAYWRFGTLYTIVLIWQIVLILLSLVILLRFGKKTKDLIKKKQVRVIFISTLATMVVGFGNSIIFGINIHIIPNLSNLSVFIFSAGLAYAVTKYKFLTITPALAADNIVETMPDLLFLLDENWNIVNVNRTAIDILGNTEKEILGQSIKNFIEDTPENVLRELKEKKVIRDRQMIFKTKTGGKIITAFAGSMAKNKETGLEYAVVVVKDMRVILGAVEKEAKERERRLSLERYSKDLEGKVRERTAELSEKVVELERWRDITVGRELEMVKLKEEIQRLKRK